MKNHHNTISQLSQHLSPLLISWSDSGGAGIAAYRIHCALRKRGINATMLVMQKKSGDPSVVQVPSSYNGTVDSSYSDDQSLKFLALRNFARWNDMRDSHPNRTQDIRYFSDTFSEIDLFRVKEVQEADVINIHWISGLINLKDMPFSLAGKPIFWTLHDMNPFTGGCHYTNSCENYLSGCGNCPQLVTGQTNDITRQIFSNKHSAYQFLDITIITPSKWLGECSQKSPLLKHFPHMVIPYCVPTTMFRPKNREQLRRQYGMKHDELVILTGAASVDDKRKGTQYLREAIEMLLRENLKQKFIFAMYGNPGNTPPVVPDLIKTISLGFIEDPEKMVDAYNLADVFVIPSLEDNLPNVVIESVSCGTPVVGFRTGGIPDMIIHKTNGYLVTQKDTEGLVDGIKWACSSNNDLRDTCRRLALEQFSEDAIANQYLEAFENRLSQRVATVIDTSDDIRDNNKERDLTKIIERKGFASAVLPKHKSRKYATEYSDEEKSVSILDQALSANPADRTALIELGHLCKLPGTSKIFCQHAMNFLDRLPEDSTIRNLVNQHQQQYWQAAIDSGQKHIFSSRPQNFPSPLTIGIAVFPDTSDQDLTTTIKALFDTEIGFLLKILIIDFTKTKINTVSNLFPKKHISVFEPGNEPASVAATANLTMLLTESVFCMTMHCGDTPVNITPLINCLRNDNSVAAAYGDAIISKQATDGDNKFSLFSAQQAGFSFLKYNFSVGPLVIWRRNIYQKIGFWDQRMDCLSAQDFWLRVSRISHLRYLPGICGKIIIGENDRHYIPEDSKQHPLLTRRYRAITEPGREVQREKDIFRYIHHSLDQGLKNFISDLTTLLEKHQLAQAIDLYDRVRGEMLTNVVLEKLDQTIMHIRQSCQSA